MPSVSHGADPVPPQIPGSPGGGVRLIPPRQDQLKPPPGVYERQFSGEECSLLGGRKHVLVLATVKDPQVGQVGGVVS